MKVVLLICVNFIYLNGKGFHLRKLEHHDLRSPVLVFVHHVHRILAARVLLKWENEIWSDFIFFLNVNLFKHTVSSESLLSVAMSVLGTNNGNKSHQQGEDLKM